MYIQLILHMNKFKNDVLTRSDLLRAVDVEIAAARVAAPIIVKLKTPIFKQVNLTRVKSIV